MVSWLHNGCSKHKTEFYAISFLILPAFYIYLQYITEIKPSVIDIQLISAPTDTFLLLEVWYYLKLSVSFRTTNPMNLFAEMSYLSDMFDNKMNIPLQCCHRSLDKTPFTHLCMFCLTEPVKQLLVRLWNYYCFLSAKPGIQYMPALQTTTHILAITHIALFKKKIKKK